MLYDFSYKNKQDTFSKPNLYDFSYKFKQGTFSRQNLYDFSYKDPARSLLKAVLV